MKKVITAMNDPFFNEKLRNIDKYEVIGKDIVYQDGIEEVLNIKKDIDLIILSDNLVGKKKITDVIEKIKKLRENIEITVFLKEKDKDVEDYLNTLKIYNIYSIEKKEDYFEKIIQNNNEIFDNIRKLKSEIYKKLEIKNDEESLHNYGDNKNEKSIEHTIYKESKQENKNNSIIKIKKNYANHKYYKKESNKERKMNEFKKNGKNITSKHNAIKIVFFNDERESQNILKVAISLILKELNYKVLNLENDKNRIEKIDNNEYDFILLNGIDSEKYLKMFNNKNNYIYIIDSRYDFYRNIENIIKIIKK